MKPVVAPWVTRVLCLRIEPVQGPVVCLTDHPVDLTMNTGQVYRSTAGHEFTGYSATHDFAPASIDLSGICAVAGVSPAQIEAGLFDHAAVFLFATDWRQPEEDHEPIVSGRFGQTTVRDDRYAISGVSLSDALNQTFSQTYGAQCPKTFGDTAYAGCGVPLAVHTVTGTLTAVVSGNEFQDGARPEGNDAFGAGTLRFTSGPNADLPALEIKSFYAGGQIVTHDGFPFLPQVGDAYEMVRGCRKRLEDCRAYGNAVNFGGFPWIPTQTVYLSRGIPPSHD
ncbi:DUF2163 domain-containing protein [Accumulibacter sp.]|uniref:DUF2163 domain-containing protein n=1 Tax=Accumulibacter sp. TaxID=2053492 RepID=UPI0025E2BF90|nr:DUF2163 domain-containing protein [Accumulibacter sp.]MCM8596657.1 DUF2163 domain-containing protein [Accumulibacter sp.]MCM8625961.1 DUF2163 domain-containing protein [Accumulibacter sp.]MDS4050805.1 DUF2163 domain-containing protein [Accumulibacter sp.]